MFLPATPKEVQSLGWNRLDIILITGDAYIDSSYIGVAVIGRVLSDRGYRVGVISQPAIPGIDDIQPHRIRKAKAPGRPHAGRNKHQAARQGAYSLYEPDTPPFQEHGSHSVGWTGGQSQTGGPLRFLE